MIVCCLTLPMEFSRMKAKITDEQLISERQNGLTLKQIAAKYGMHIRTVEGRSAKLSRAGFGHDRDYRHIVPDGYKVKGVSSLMGKDGEIKMSWLKTDVDRERQREIMEQMIEAYTSELPREEATPSPSGVNEDLLALYPIFDLHIGALAHRHECGENYDTAEAERIMNKFFDYSIQSSPDAERAVFLLGGDVLHYDGMTPVTPASGHVLDSDSRYAKLVYVALRATRRAINMLLKKHKQVDVQILPGNHDESGMVWLRAAMAAIYENEPRIFVDTSPAIMHRTQWGKTLIGYTHGHTQKKPEVRLSVLATDYREEFGKARYVYCHSGHWHHQTITEIALGIDEIHGQLGAKDAYAANGGWRSMRQAAVIVYSKEFGEIGRFTVRPEMFNSII